MTNAIIQYALVIVSEAVCREVIDRASAFTAVESVFAAMAKGDAYNFPVIREAIGHADALYGFKSGFDRAGMTLGLKSGGYWPGNSAKGLTNHQSTIFLFDPDTGKLKALVGGIYLTAARTAVSSAVSMAHLAREDSNTLGIIGAGHQASFQLRAAVEQRQFERIVAWNKSPKRLDSLAEVASSIGLPFEALEREQVAAQSDVIITITSAQEPLLMNNWIRPGTHIACMGTDTRGKTTTYPADKVRRKQYPLSYCREYTVLLPVHAGQYCSFGGLQAHHQVQRGIPLRRYSCLCV